MSFGRHVCVSWKDFCFGSICSPFNLVFYKVCLEKKLEKLFECTFLVCILLKWYQNRRGNGIDIYLNNFWNFLRLVLLPLCNYLGSLSPYCDTNCLVKPPTSLHLISNWNLLYIYNCCENTFHKIWLSLVSLLEFRIKSYILWKILVDGWECIINKSPSGF